MDVAALVNCGDTVITDNNREGIESCSADSNRVGCLKVEGLEEEWK